MSFILLGWLLLGYQPIEEDQTLRIAGPFEFTSEDLSKDGFIYTRMQVAESLFEVSADGQLSPKLATAFHQSNDALTWHFPIRPGVEFHDGELLTAESVVFSLTQALKKPGVLHQLPIDNLYAQGNNLVIELNEPYKPIVSVLGHFSAAILSPNSFNESGNVVNIRGTGPYRVSLLAPPHKINVEKFESYWGEPPGIKEVHYLTGHRAESRALQAQSNQADLVYTLDPASLDLLQRADNLVIHSESIPRTVLIKLNNEHPFLNNIQTRRAISLALDRKGISEHVIRVPDSEAYQLFPPSISQWHLKTENITKRNLSDAKQLLADLDWKLNSDGILEREGEAFRLNLVTYADRPELTTIATAIQAQLREVGIDIQIIVDNSSSIPSRHHDNTLEMALIARNYGTISDPLALLVDDTMTHAGRDWGPMNWSSVELNNTLEAMMACEEQEYFALAQQAAQYLADEMPMIPVVFYTQQVAINKRVKNFQFDPFENNYRVSEMYFDN
ncbi:ABC transporter substrate-binding protein [Vibrio sp. FNV 38]|nr:ABC transporter substrate-binding protein [Vibrio sp. FNV 38]